MKMEPVVNYVKLLEESWEELQNWALDCRFGPQSEGDIQCFLYHCLVEKLGTAKDIHSEYKYEYERGRRVRIDLVIADKVFVEIKYILWRTGRRTEASWKNRKRDAEKAIGRLRLIRRDSATYRFLAIFAENYEKEDAPWYDDIKKLCDKSGIKMLKACKRKVEKKVI